MTSGPAPSSPMTTASVPQSAGVRQVDKFSGTHSVPYAYAGVQRDGSKGAPRLRATAALTQTRKEEKNFRMALQVPGDARRVSRDRGADVPDEGVC